MKIVSFINPPQRDVIDRILAEDPSEVQFGQVLFRIRPIEETPTICIARNCPKLRVKPMEPAHAAHGRASRVFAPTPATPRVRS